MVRKLEVKSNLESIIEKGAPVVADNKIPVDEKSHHILNLRMPLIVWQEIEQAAKKRIGFSKTVWILEAIQEKLKRENIPQE